MDIKTYKSFKEKFTPEERVKEFEKQKNRYPTMIPIIVDISKNAKNIKILEKQKFIVSKDVKMLEFQQTVNKKLGLTNAKDGIFYFIGNKKIEKLDKPMLAVYEENKDKEDGFLYVTYTDQAVLGFS